MSLEPIDIAFRNATAAAAEQQPGALPAWTPTGEADGEAVNRFREVLGDLGDARPAERIWDMVNQWNTQVRMETETLGDKLKTADTLSMGELLHLQILSHNVTLAQSLMAKAGSSVSETSNALIRGQ